MSAPLSLLAWIMAAFFTIVLQLSGLIFLTPFSLIFDRHRRTLEHRVAKAWARSIIGTSPVWKLRVTGKENVKSGRRYVIVANHQSILDILVLLAGLDLHFKFLAKKELFTIPFLGWHMANAGYIPLDRGNRESAKDAMAARRTVSRTARCPHCPVTSVGVARSASATAAAAATISPTKRRSF